jgi:hypothetical protein
LSDVGDGGVTAADFYGWRRRASRGRGEDKGNAGCCGGKWGCCAIGWRWEEMGGRKWRTACGAAFLWLVLGEKPKEGGRGLHCEGFLGFFFLFFQNCPPSLLYVLETPIYRQKCC